MTHASLFSGIGGFDLAAQWCGMENIFAVEINQFCQQVLKKNFPNTKIYSDIKEFNGTEYKGTVDIISGGFPCQPFSQAGKRKGNQDERALFPEMLRIINEVRPKWVVAENVYGIVNIQDGEYFEEVCTQLENIGYSVQPIIIPASSLDAPHQRYRTWFIAKSESVGNRGWNNKEFGISERLIQQEESRRSEVGGESQGCDREFTHYSNTTSEGFERTFQSGFNTKCIEQPIDNTIGFRRIEKQFQGRIASEAIRETSQRQPIGTTWSQHWLEVATELCSVDDGLSVELGEFKLSKSKHREEQLKAYGNAIVPQIAYLLFQIILEMA